MPRITVDLVRRRAEHNNCEISTLEELSLHQQDLERIEHLDRWCKNLKILYLQNNLISRIENVGRLKQLQYLNLALNNIETVENLQNCEFLEKLDLTLNFIGDLLSIDSLTLNIHLKELVSLDGTEITRSERILATQQLHMLREEIVRQQEEHKVKRSKQKVDHEERKKRRENKKKPGFNGRWYTDSNSHLAKEQDGETREDVNEIKNDEEDDEFWDEDTPYTPESRVETLMYMAEKRKETAKEPDRGPEPAKRVRKLEMDGKILNINEGKYEFHLTESGDDSYFLLDIAIPRFMDTSLVDCDVQPTHVTVTIKGKILQLVLQEDVSPDRSSAKRSQTNGHLLLTMPKARQTISRKRNTQSQKTSTITDEKRNSQEPTKKSVKNKTVLLEVDPNVKKGADFSNIVPKNKSDSKSNTPSRMESNTPPRVVSKLVSELSLEDKESKPEGEFVDDPDVPPLM